TQMWSGSSFLVPCHFPPSPTLFPYTTLFRSLDDANNDVATLAADYSGTISYRDLNSLVVGTVSDTSMGTTTSSGIRTSGTLAARSEEHTTELQSRRDVVCRLLRAEDIRLGTS